MKKSATVRANPAVVRDIARFLDQVNPDRPRPVKLQLNQAGAWRNVVSFDASEEIKVAEVLDAAEKLGHAANVTLRVVIDDNSPSPTVLMRWKSIEEGWKEAR